MLLKAVLCSRRSLLRAAIAIFIVSILPAAVAQVASSAPGSAPPVAPVAPVAAADSTKTASAGMHLGAGDLVEIKFFGVPDLTQEVRVNSAGEISLALAGPVPVAGLTAEEAATAVAAKYEGGGFLKSPQVTIFVKGYTSQNISVMGEVAHPGIFPIMGSRRLYDVIAAAGGFTNRAGKLVTITRRDRPQEPQQVVFNDDPAKSLEGNVEVSAGDTVLVSKAGLVYVVGDVGRPGGYVMENNERITVLQAIALAGGVNRTAALNSAKLIRRGSDGPKETSLQLKKILAAKASDAPLQAEDIIFVPGSAAKNAAKRGLEAMIQAATQVAIYTPIH